MITYIILLAILVIICISSYFVFEKDILSVSFVTSIMFIFSLVLSMIGLLSWNTEVRLENKTILIVSLGVFSFFIGELIYYLINKVKNKNGSCKIYKKDLKQKEQTEENKKILFILALIMLIFSIITIIKTIIEEKKVCIGYGHNPNGLPDLLRFYRTKTLLYSSDAKNKIEISSIVKQMQKVCYFACVYNIYFLIKNLVSKKFKKENIIYILTILSTMFLTLLTSSRSLLMHLFVAAILIFLLELKKQKIELNKKIICSLIGGVVAILVIFTSLTSLVGRQTKMKGIDYITFYLGAPIPSLNRYINGDIKEERKKGENTFYGIYYTLGKLKITDSYPVGTHKGAVFKDYGGSNVYTSFMEYYLDYGFAGIIILNVIFGFVMTFLYKFVLTHYENKFYVVTFAYYYYVMIDQIRGNQFYNLISISTISYLFVSYILYVYYYKLPIYINDLKLKIKKEN